MKRIALGLACLLTLYAVPALAQFGVYGKFDLDHYTDYNWLHGGGGGVYDDFLHAGPVALGGDLRGDFMSGERYDYRSLLLGLRLAVKLPALPVRPYLEPMAGVGGARYTGPIAVDVTNASYDYYSKLTYGIVGGLDWTLLPHVDWRVIEAGYVREKNGSLPNPNVLLSTGLVFRF